MYRHQSTSKEPFTLQIGNGNVFEIESSKGLKAELIDGRSQMVSFVVGTEASSIGNNNVVEVRGTVGFIDHFSNILFRRTGHPIIDCGHHVCISIPYRTLA